MAVGIAHDAKPVAAFERVMQNPFEGAPGGVNLNGRFQSAVMREFDIGIAPADMRDTADRVKITSVLLD